MSKRFFIRTFGCQMNEHDSERLASLFLAEGMVRAESPDDADLVLLNTCCIRENAANKLYGHLGHLKSLRERRPGMQIAVGGCLAQSEGAAIRARADHVDVVFGTHNLARAPELLRRASTAGPQVEILEEPFGDQELEVAPLSAAREVPYSAWVTIQTGCDNSCAFCIVPSVRGREVSRSMELLVQEVRGLASNGVSEVTLLGQNVNSYGRDLTRRRPLFAELLRKVGEQPGIRRVRFTSPHPKDLRPETVEAMAQVPSVCEHLHLPLQSGSDRILSAMRRGYTAERYLARLEAARSAISDLAVTTDIIVGFPGETEEDFVRTLEVAAEAGYDSAYTFIFSPRPGTRAAEMEDDFVPEELIGERFERLRSVVERSALVRHRARVGLVEEVLVEGTSKRDRDLLTARTRQNKLVHFAPAGPEPDGAPGAGLVEAAGTSDRELRPGSYAQVRITKAAPHHLTGELVSVTSTPRRVRIPVPVTAG